MRSPTKCKKRKAGISQGGLPGGSDSEGHPEQ